MTVHTALEIYENSDDLTVMVSKLKGVRGYGGVICLGPQHRYKLLITTNKAFEKRAEAVAAMKYALETARKLSHDFLRKWARGTGILTRAQCRQIVAALHTRRTVETFRQAA